MATTTNNGWTTPNDTDLVKDGALAIRTLGNGIDTSTGTGLIAWQSWTPTLSSGWLNGNGVWTAKYAKLGKIVIATGYFVVGSTTTKGSTMNISLPFTAASTVNINGVAWCGLTSTTTISALHLFPANSTTITLFAQNTGGTYLSSGSVTSIAPFTWATNSVVSFTAIYESA
jgi:hypothetical protein